MCMSKNFYMHGCLKKDFSNISHMTGWKTERDLWDTEKGSRIIYERNIVRRYTNKDNGSLSMKIYSSVTQGNIRRAINEDQNH